jgi:hypothetical protein
MPIIGPIITIPIFLLIPVSSRLRLVSFLVRLRIRCEAIRLHEHVKQVVEIEWRHCEVLERCCSRCE